MSKFTKAILKLILNLHKILGTGFLDESNRRLTLSNIYIILIALSILTIEITRYFTKEVFVGKKSEFYGIIIHLHGIVDISMLSTTLLLEMTINWKAKRKLYTNYRKIRKMLNISQNDSLIRKCIIIHVYGFSNILFNRIWKYFSKFKSNTIILLSYTFLKSLSEEFLFIKIVCEVYYCIFCFRKLNEKLYSIKKSLKESIKLEEKLTEQVITLMKTYQILEDNIKFISKRVNIMVIKIK